MEDLTLLIALALVALGLGASTYGVLIGSGGGFIIAPLLIILFDMDHTLAVGTGLVIAVLASVSGSISYLRLRYVDLRAALLFSIAAIPATILGVLGLRQVSADAFQIIYGAILVPLGLYIIISPGQPKEQGVSTQGPDRSGSEVPPSRSRPFGARTSTIVTADRGTFRYTYNEPLAVGLNSLFGFMAGFFGMGGGPLRTPTLFYLFQFPIYIAAATSVFAGIIITGVGSLAHLVDGNIDWPVALPVGAGVIAGAQISVRLSRRVQGRWVMRLLSLALLAVGAELIISGVGVG